jgi:hypothetical protein
MNNILVCTESIINSFDSILDMMNNILYIDNLPNNNIIYEIVRQKELKNTYIIKKTEIEQEIYKCDNTIYKLCDHDFIEDYIDLTPDTSQKIEYCSVCELTKRECIPLSRL